MFIKKIFENKIDDSVHKQFIRFGKGKYSNRAIIKITRQPEKIKIGTSFELANDLVEFCSSLSSSLKCSGVILAKEKIIKLEKFNLTKKGELIQYETNEILDSILIKNILKDPSFYYALLDIESQGILLKSKKKLPKPGKSGELKIDDKFCQLELDMKFWLKVKTEFCFDMPDFKKAFISHTYIITDIIMPIGEKDFKKIRLLAKRRGKIIRKINFDSSEITKEKEFEA